MGQLEFGEGVEQDPFEEPALGGRRNRIEVGLRCQFDHPVEDFQLKAGPGPLGDPVLAEVVGERAAFGSRTHRSDGLPVSVEDVEFDLEARCSPAGVLLARRLDGHLNLFGKLEPLHFVTGNHALPILLCFD